MKRIKCRMHIAELDVHRERNELRAEVKRLQIHSSVLMREVERLRTDLHYNKGCCDLAMKHRDEAEAKVKRLEALLARY